MSLLSKRARVSSSAILILVASKKSNDLHVNAMVAFSFGKLLLLRLSQGTVPWLEMMAVGEAVVRGASEVPNRVVQRGPVTTACKGPLSYHLLGASYSTLTLIRYSTQALTTYTGLQNHRAI